MTIFSKCRLNSMKTTFESTIYLGSKRNHSISLSFCCASLQVSSIKVDIPSIPSLESKDLGGPKHFQLQLELCRKSPSAQIFNKE